MDPKRLLNYYFPNTALSYNSNDTLLNGPHWESGSKNVLTSVRQWAERAPGFGGIEASSSVFTGPVVRLYTWEQWDGTFYIMLCETYTITGPHYHSKVWKLQVGTDATFQALYDDVSDTVVLGAWDFCVSNNTLYMMNGNQSWAWNGLATAVRPWGIGTSPMVGPAGEYAKGRCVATTGTTGITATVGYRYVYCYYNSSTTDASSASNPSATTGAFANKTVTLSLMRSTDAQVDKVRVYRTTDGGGGIYFEIANSPFAHTPALSPVTGTHTGANNAAVLTDGTKSWTVNQWAGYTVFNRSDGSSAIIASNTANTVTATLAGGSENDWDTTDAYTISGLMTATDATTDANLSSFKAPVGPDLGNSATPTPHGINDPPTAGYGPVWYANRIWWFLNNKVYYSGWEEIVDVGLEEECVPPGNQLVFNQKVTGLSSTDEFLLIFTASAIWKITGDSISTFARDPLFKKIGCRNRACIGTYGKSVAWFDSSHTIRITDGFQQKELSLDIRPDLASISFTTTSLSFYSQGTMHWLCLLDGTGGKMYVYDLDLEQWLPPWEHVGASTALYWGEIASGTPALLIGSPSKKGLKITPTVYTFDGSTYAAELLSYLVPLVPPEQNTRIGNAQTILIERNAIALTDVLELRDEDTDTGTYVSDFANVATVGTISPPLRPKATNLVEEWFGTQQTGCKRISIKFKWAAAATNFKLYSFGVGFYEL
jgi:hypothetical protein